MGKRKALWHAFSNDLERNLLKLTDAVVPPAAYADERDGALFDSSRDYLTQNEIYQAHKGNESDEEV